MSAPGLSHGGPRQGPRPHQRLARQRPCDAASLLTDRRVHAPRYSFDPGALLAHSIQEQVDRFYRDPKFDTGPCQPSLTAFRLNRKGWRRGDPFVRRNSLRPTAAEWRPAAPRRQSSILSSAPSSSQSAYILSSLPATQRQRLHRVAAAATPRLASTLAAPSKSTAWSEQRRKEGMVESGLESVQNLIGLGSYFAQHLDVTYRLLSVSSGGARASAAGPCSGEQVNAAGSRCGTRGTPQVPYPFSAPVPGFPYTSSVRRPEVPSGGHPSSTVRARCAQSPGQSELLQCAGSRTQAALYTCAVNDTASLSSPAAADAYGDEVSPSVGGSASTFSLEGRDLLFGEDPLVTELLQAPETAACTAETHRGAYMQAARGHATAFEQAASNARVVPSPAALATASFSRFSFSSAYDALVPRASQSLANHEAALNLCVGGVASSADARKPAAALATESPCTRETIDLKRSRGLWRHYRAVNDLFQQLLRLRVHHEHAMCQGPCPCGVCDDRFLASPPHGPRRASSSRAGHPLSSDRVAARVPTHDRVSRTNSSGRRLHARPAVDHYHGSAHCNDHGPSAPPLRCDVHLGKRGANTDARLLSGHSRCDSSILHDAFVPTPPPAPRDGASSALRRGPLRPSSAAQPRERSSRTSKSSAAPRAAPPYCVPYRGREAEYGRPFSSATEGRADVGRERGNDAGAPRERDEDAHDDRSLTEHLRGVARGIRAGRKGSSTSFVKDAASDPDSGAAHLSAVALPEALREEAHPDDGAYSELVRVPKAAGRAIPEAIAVEETEAAAVARTAMIPSQDILQLPLALQPPHVLGRSGVAVETVASSTSLHELRGDTNPALLRTPSAALPANEDTLPWGPAAVPEPLPTSETVPSSSCSSSVSSIALSSDSSSSLDSPVFALLGDTNASAAAPVADSHPIAVKTPAHSNVTFESVLRSTVVRVQLRVLSEQEGALRERLGVDEEDARWGVYCERTVEGEALRRRALALEEAVERRDLARQCDWVRSRILVAEDALKQSQVARKEEDDAWECSGEDAGLAAVAVAAKSAVTGALQVGMDKLSTAEEMLRRGTVMRERAVRLDLRVKMCRDVEVCARGDLEFAECFGRLGLTRAYVVCCPAHTRAISDAASTRVEEGAEGGGIEGPTPVSASAGESSVALRAHTPAHAGMASEAAEPVAPLPPYNLYVNEHLVDASAPPADVETVFGEHAHGEEGIPPRPHFALHVSGSTSTITPPKLISPSVCAS
ncbi:hypothetical protein LSCM1_03818 [Leishmania martiniquensis]|uniref:Uncharacterized protein n=1 Tax=Leishmania martiniquensis TaxID=1580590 RepID=A0A836GHT7_9TRYP|nr:hypothetical protein LSCM1_03818 [Leishmania martiniquensis]